MEPPRDLRFISLKYAGRCRSCAKSLKTGEGAHWSPAQKAVWCKDCAGGENVSAQVTSDDAARGSRNATKTASQNRTGAARPPASPSRTPWQQLCEYARRCIEAEAAKSLVPYVKENSLWFLHPGQEKLVVGQNDSVPAPEELANFLFRNRLRDGRSIMYGWPTAVVVSRDHTPMVAPLFFVHVEPELKDNDRWELHATGEPEFNLAITASGIFDPSVSEDINDLISDGLPFGDADAFAVLAAQTADLLGIDIPLQLNSSVLQSSINRRQGVYNAAVAVVAETSGYTAALRDELRALQTREDWATTAAARLLPDGFAFKESKRSPFDPVAAPLACNQSQEETLGRFRQRTLTVVTGPPGTGKTQLVVNTVTNAWLDGEKVLVTSTNNGAVDVAVERAEKDVCSGLLIRTGNRDLREQVPDRIAVVSAQAAVRRDNEAAARAQLKRVASERRQLMEQLARLDELDEKLLQVVEKRAELKPALKEAAGKLWADASPPHLFIGSHQVERRSRRVLRAWLFRRLRGRRLRRRLGCLETAPLKQLVTWARLDQRVAQLTSRLEIALAERRQLKTAVGDPAARVREKDQKWAEASLFAIRTHTAARIHAGTDRLAAFGTISAGTGHLKRAISNSLHHLRGWACTALSASSNFPLESGLFDLVVVDEASQCGLAAILPLAYRAKRLAVVGDPYQLNPIVALSDGLLRDIATQTGFDNDTLRERGIHHKDGSAYSAFEFAARPQTPVLLNEHYRCHPHIARWFNRTFYKGELTILTDVSDTAKRHRVISWYDVEGAAERPAAGSWLNRTEAEQTVKQIRQVFDSGYKTVGVVTPFAAQAQLIARLAQRQYGQDFLDDIEFVCGTAHRLQGNERQAIVLSPVLSPDMSKSGARWIEKERNLLNVAVSRARRALIVLGHPRMEELGSPTLASLRVYLRSEVARSEVPVEPSAEFRTDSDAEQRLLDAMQFQNLLPYAKLGVEGYELDFALLEQGIKLNIEVDGDQHLDARGRQRRQDIARDSVLTNLGWTVLRVAAWQCHQEIDTVIEEIMKMRNLLLDGASRQTF